MKEEKENWLIKPIQMIKKDISIIIQIIIKKIKILKTM